MHCALTPHGDELQGLSGAVDVVLSYTKVFQKHYLNLRGMKPSGIIVGRHFSYGSPVNSSKQLQTGS